MPQGMVSVVADSYDMDNLTEHILGEQLKEQVKNRHAVNG
jgi:hypothetical protein